jgi:hypothetical protein
VAYQLRSRDLERRMGTVLALEQQTRQAFAAAQKLAGLNQTLARENLLSSRKDLLARAEAALGVDWQKQTGNDAKKLQQVLRELEKEIAAVSHVYLVDDPELFYDFALLKANPRIVSAALFKGEIMVLDAENGALFSLGTKNKTAAIAGGGEAIKKGSFLDFSGEKIYVAGSEGVFLVSRGSSSPRPLFKPSEKWGRIAALKTFAGNLYLLDTSNSQIWKYQGTDLGLQDAAPYLRTANVDFTRAADLAIDGYAYVLSSSGAIARFGGGLIDDLPVSGLDKPFNNPARIFATDEAKNIYILDAGNSRVVVLDKAGAYQSQYVLPGDHNLEPGTLLLVDESVAKIFLISKDKVYAVAIRLNIPSTFSPQYPPRRAVPGA